MGGVGRGRSGCLRNSLSWWLTFNLRGEEKQAICWIFTANITCSPAWKKRSSADSGAENDQQTLISQILLTGKSDHYSAVLNVRVLQARMAGGKRQTVSRHHKSIIYIWPLKMTGCRRQVCSSWSGIVTNSPGGESGVEDPCDELRRLVVSARSTKTRRHSQTAALKPPTLWFFFQECLFNFSWRYDAWLCLINFSYLIWLH